MLSHKLSRYARPVHSQLLNTGIRLLLAATASAGIVFSQARMPPARSEFEVASVKPTARADGRALLQAVPGRLLMTNLALRRLILIAYGVSETIT